MIQFVRMIRLPDDAWVEPNKIELIMPGKPEPGIYVRMFGRDYFFPCASFEDAKLQADQLAEDANDAIREANK